MFSNFKILLKDDTQRYIIAEVIKTSEYLWFFSKSEVRQVYRNSDENYLATWKDLETGKTCFGVEELYQAWLVRQTLKQGRQNG